MKISLIKAGKRFNREWVFRNLSFEFIHGNAYAIIGPNGSGKSTLLQIIAGAMGQSEGDVQYAIGNMQYASDQVYRYISITAPYLELIEEMTLVEFLSFHHRFKPQLAGINISEIISIVGLDNAAHKQIRYYSSGMKQRVKLAQAIFSDVPCVLLDEPCTNLDEEGINLYGKLINHYCNNRLVIVSSNDQSEYRFCKEMLNVLDYK